VTLTVTKNNPGEDRLMAARETELTIREFEPGDEAAFRMLNEEWIKRYFVIEPKDESSFADPRGSILARGGRIFLAVQDGQTIGCCALLAMGSGEFEVAKMAVSESHQRNGIGRRLLEKAIAEARASGAHRLYLETNRKMQPAIRLYESLGFRHLPPERIVPSPYARANVYMELLFDGTT
jgi:putative acetyltransferase